MLHCLFLFWFFTRTTFEDRLWESETFTKIGFVLYYYSWKIEFVDKLYRHLQGESIAGYTSISNHELDTQISRYKSGHPNDGERMIIGYLRSCDTHVQISRIRESIWDPNGLAERRRTAIRHRVYHVDYPNEVWHIDGNHKLIRWKFVVHGAVGFSWTVTMLNCSTNNQATTVLHHFLTAVAVYGLPSKVRTDAGGENVDIWRNMIQQRGTSAAVVGNSVHNTHIERLWRDVRKSVLEPISYINCIGLLNPDNEVDIFCLHQALRDCFTIFHNLFWKKILLLYSIPCCM